MIKRLLHLLFLFIISHQILLAGTTGKISGSVKDAETGESLPGINIIIEGTTLGAASDVDGNFVINNISPGTYVIIASGVGLQSKRFIDVKIVADFTTDLDFEMSTESIDLETVVVQAVAPLIRKDLTSSHVAIDSEQIESLPVESINQILSLQAGITRGVDGELHIRGGRSTEIAYSVNGVSINNPYNNSSTVTVATNAIQELSVVSGTFNAEYGNALSGIVNTVTKEGGNNFNGSVSFYTGDYLSNNTDIFYNIDDFDPLNNYVTEMTLSGPIPFSNNILSFFLSGRYNNDEGYLYAIRERTTSDYVRKNPFNPNDLEIIATGDGSIIGMNAGKSVSTTAKLTLKPSSALKFNYDFLYSYGNYKPYDHDLKYNPDANNDRFNESYLHILEMRQVLSNTTFYTIRGSYNIEDSKRYLFPLLDSSGNEVDFSAGMSLSGLHPDSRYEPDYKSTTDAAPVSFSNGGTYQGGGQSHSYQRTEIIGVKFDITSQASRTHEIKAGGQFRAYNIKAQFFDILRDTTRYLIPTIASEGSSRNNQYSKDPYELSFYAQDKMEFDNLVLNVGLRYDYFMANSQYSTNVLYPTPNDPGLPTSVDGDELLQDAEAKQQISPRIGVSFPITDQGIIHFSYGHFFQLPPLSYLFTNSEFKYTVGAPTYGNANLNPERTVSYELGLQQQLTDNIAINLTGYYKDVRDLLATQQIRVSGDKTYYTYVNKDYANIKGIVFSFVKRRTPSSLIGATLDYTFQVAEGNEVSSDAFFIDLSSGRQSEKIPVYLNWDKSHQLNGTVSFGDIKNWNVTLVGRIGTGLPYTPEIYDKQVFLEPNSGRRPIQSSVDVLAEKTFSLSGIDLVIFAKIYNLFDQLNESSVYTTTGRASYTLDSNRGPAIETDRMAQQYEGVKTSGEVYNNPAFYLPPREVRLGLSIEF